jgi:AcrR family transcriptional regulator
MASKRVRGHFFGNVDYPQRVQEADSDGPRRLPPGPHGIPSEVVARNQRERLIAAMAEVCGEGGYAAATVAEVAGRAGVSTASFYRQFKDRRECMLTSFDELFGRLLSEVERACEAEAEPAKKAEAGIRTAAALLAGDPPTARLLTIEIAAVGTEGVRFQHEAIERLAARLSEALETGAGGSVSFPSAEWAAVAAMVALVAKRVAEGESAGAAELETLVAQL